MYKELKVRIKGISPLLLHNGLLSDPLYGPAQDMKKVSGKRKKTDEDHMELGRLEFFGSLYTDDDGAIVIPGENIESMLVEAAKKQKLGREFKSGLICDGLWPIEHDGPKEPAKLWLDKRFVDRRPAKVQQARVIRTRPKFTTWSLSFVVNYLPTVLNVEQVREAIITAGRVIGLGDYRPKFGRFEVA